ncbi:MAG TPA: hypothetical protein VF161_10390 [Steroidobacteraceae bacterium]
MSSASGSIELPPRAWVGDRPQDIADYLAAYGGESYPVHAFRLAKCSCGSLEFELEADDNEGTARRTCAVCGKRHLICESEEYWDGSRPEKWQCVDCRSSDANVGVGFSLDSQSGEVTWLHVGYRCANCGVLGCFVGWKVSYTPSRQLLEKV